MESVMYQLYFSGSKNQKLVKVRLKIECMGPLPTKADSLGVSESDPTALLSVAFK